MMTVKANQAGGFTLIEVLAAIILISLFSTVFYPAISHHTNSISRKSDLLHSLRSLNNIIILEKHEIDLDFPENTFNQINRHDWTHTTRNIHSSPESIICFEYFDHKNKSASSDRRKLFILATIKPICN